MTVIRLSLAHPAGELLMAVRQHASTMHDRDGLMEVAFEGVGSLPMAVIERYREQRRYCSSRWTCTMLLRICGHLGTW